MSQTFESLPRKKKDLLAAIGSHESTAVSIPGGGALVFCTQGARLLGLFPTEDSWNPLWTHPALKHQLDDGAWNTGGERLWLSPERDFLCKDAANFRGWFCAPEYDPGQYRIVEHNQQKGLSFQRTFDLADHFHAKKIQDVTTTRTFLPLPNPYPARRDVFYAGVLIRERVELPTGNVEHIHPWSVTQIFLPAGQHGSMLVPVNRNAAPVHCLRTIPENRLRCSENLLAFKLDGDEVLKLGIAPEDVDLSRGAHVLYLGPTVREDKWVIVLKASEDVPMTSAKCFDVAASDPSRTTGIIQSYNNGPLPKQDRTWFGELELQLSPLARRGNGYCSEVSHQLLVYEGPKQNLVRLAEEVLGRESLFIFS